MRAYGAALVLSLFLSASAVANEAHDRLSRMSEAERNKVFAVFMQRSGEPCGRVSKSFFQGLDKKRNAFWSIACSNRQSFQVMIYNDSAGSTKILECSILKTVAKVDCFKKF